MIRLIDEFSELLAKESKTEAEKQLLQVCLQGISQPTVSAIPFSHLVASYQAALKNPSKTLEIIGRTEHKATVDSQAELIERELGFSPRVTLQTGLRQTFTWFADNAAWWSGA